MIKKTGVKVTGAELKEARDRAREKAATPVAKVAGRWLSDDAEKAHSEWVDALAVLHGLPAPPTIDGEVHHYGMDAEGEFTTYEPGEEPTPAPSMTPAEFAEKAEALRARILDDIRAAREKASAIQGHVQEMKKLGFDPSMGDWHNTKLLSSVMGRDWTADVRHQAQNDFYKLFLQFMGWK